MKITVVIPAYNEEKTILNCLNALYAQHDNRIQFETIIVDDCSTDNTVNKVRQFSNNNNIKNLTIHESDKNKGRFQARITGINQSKYDLVLFLDCKVQIDQQAFASIEKINYQPLVATNVYPTRQSVIERTFYLIRKKVYRGNYPKVKLNPSYLDRSSFDFYPKGTTVFLCRKDLLLDTLPKRTDKNSSDDTAWLRNIASKKPIMLNNDVEFKYNPRERFTDIMKHLFLRGPKFADYYYNPGKRFYWLINLALILALSTFAAILSIPSMLYSFLLVFLATIAITSSYLAIKIEDLPKLMIALPLITITFGLGVIYGIVLKHTQKPR